ncbi:MAG: hypothetical protein ABL958_13360 [Bdellovibrionia bacterium]
MSDKKITRREALRIAGGAGLAGAAILGFQNCGNNANFEQASLKSDCGFKATPPVCESGGDYLDGQQVQTAPAGDIHNMQVRIYNPQYFDQTAVAFQNQCMMEVQVGSDPAAGQYHPIDYTNLKRVHAITDIFVIDRASCQTVLWRRFNNSDREPSTLMMLNEQLASSSSKLKVIACCSVHGFFGVNVDMATYPVTDYNTVVGTFNAALPFGGSTLKYPYVARSATGGQGDLGVLHAPLVTGINNMDVEAVLGGTGSPHGRLAENHYVNGGALFDQNGHPLTEISLIRYGDAGTAATGPVVKFSNLNLSARGVTSLRISVFDTYNGYLMGFLKRV